MASISGRGKIILSPVNYTNRLWGRPSLLFDRKWGRCALRQSGQGVKLTTQGKSENKCSCNSACLISHHDLGKDNITQSGFDSQSAFQPVMPPYKGLLPPEQWSSFCPRPGLQPRRELVSVSATPVIVQDVSY
jgi:hypothetical protein